MSPEETCRTQVYVTWGRNWRRESKDSDATKTLGIKVILEMGFMGNKALQSEIYIYFLKQLQGSPPSFSKKISVELCCSQYYWRDN